VDKKSIIKDILSPSSLWTLFQYGSPTAAAAVSAFLTYLWHLPPSVILLLALASASCAIIIFDAIKRASARGKILIEKFYVPVVLPQLENRDRYVVQFAAHAINTSLDLPICFEFEVLNYGLQNKANMMAVNNSPPVYLPPGRAKSILFPVIKDLVLGEVKGKLLLRARYGKSEKNLNITDEWNFLIEAELLHGEKPELVYKIITIGHETR
jgi:hypothetical protein